MWTVNHLAFSQSSLPLSPVPVPVRMPNQTHCHCTYLHYCFTPNAVVYYFHSQTTRLLRHRHRYPPPFQPACRFHFEFMASHTECRMCGNPITIVWQCSPWRFPSNGKQYLCASYAIILSIWPKTAGKSRRFQVSGYLIASDTMWEHEMLPVNGWGGGRGGVGARQKYGPIERWSGWRGMGQWQGVARLSKTTIITAIATPSSTVTIVDPIDSDEPRVFRHSKHIYLCSFLWMTRIQGTI